MFIGNCADDKSDDDWFFKLLGIADIEHIAYLLNCFYTFEKPIEHLKYLPTELIPLSKKEKMSIVDLMFTDDLGRYFIIEMQQYPFQDLVDRLQYNAAKILSRSLVVAQKYGELKDVYTICFLNYELFSGDNNYISRLSFHREGEAQISRGKIHFLFVEIIKWENLGKFDTNDIRSYWLLFFTKPHILKRMIELMTPEEEKQFNQFCKIVALWDTTQYTEAQLRGYDHYIDEIRVTNSIRFEEYEKGIEKGIEKGVEKGLELGVEITFKVVTDLKNSSISINEIAEKYNITVQQVEHINNQMNLFFNT